MTDRADVPDAISLVAGELVPQLSERLRRHGLGEIEVATGEMRLRIRASATAPTPARQASPAAAAATPAATPDPTSVAVTSPAVGFFVYADGLGPGLVVSKGDPLGHVEMLGVRHEVHAPRGGTVRSLVAEAGEAVEYGQVVLEIEPGGAAS